MIFFMAFNFLRGLGIIVSWFYKFNNYRNLLPDPISAVNLHKNKYFNYNLSQLILYLHWQKL